MSHLLETSIPDLVRLQSNRTISSLDLVRDCVERAKEIDTWLNCFVEINEAGMLSDVRELDAQTDEFRASKSLLGIPLAHKDVFFRQGRPTQAGNPILSNSTKKETATCLSRLARSGALDLGRLQTAEFAMSPTGYNKHFAPVHNPWNTDYCTGGSSSGSAAAVAAGAILGSLGTDTGGSVRQPAAMCGLTGLKPTHSTIPADGVFPLSPSLDVVGILARSAEDCHYILSAIVGCSRVNARLTELQANEGSRLPLDGILIAIPENYFFEEMDKCVAAALDEARRTFEDLGATFKSTNAADMQRICDRQHSVFSFEAALTHSRLLSEKPHVFSSQVRARLEMGLGVSTAMYEEAVLQRIGLRRAFIGSAFDGADAILLPTVPCSTPRLDDDEALPMEAILKRNARITRCCRPLNYLDLPSIAVPCGFDRSKLPVSFQLVGPQHSEGLLLSIASRYQKATNWHTRRPANAI